MAQDRPAWAGPLFSGAGLWFCGRSMQRATWGVGLGLCVVVAAGGDYVWMVKENQPALLADLEALLVAIRRAAAS